MKVIIRIKEILGTEIRTRMMIENFSTTLIPDNEYLLDMDGVLFISRSATDELYNLIEMQKHVVIVNMSDFVQKMFDTVAIGRFSSRDLKTIEVPVTYCHDMSSLSKCLTSLNFGRSCSF